MIDNYYNTSSVDTGRLPSDYRKVRQAVNRANEEFEKIAPNGRSKNGNYYICYTFETLMNVYRLCKEAQWSLVVAISTLKAESPKKKEYEEQLQEMSKKVDFAREKIKEFQSTVPMYSPIADHTRYRIM